MITTDVFEQNIVAYNKDRKGIVINQGGTSSGKTYAILQLLYLIATLSPSRLIISVCSYALPHLKLGAVRDFEKILVDEGVNIEKIRNKTEGTYDIGKSIIEFFGTDNLAKVHGPRRDILFINEANNVKFDIYTQLIIRTDKAVFIDYNPVLSFWVHDEVIPNEPHTFIKSTYLDNDQLSQSIIDRIEARKNNESWWRVYGLGELGQLEGAIYTNWTHGEFDNTLPYAFGLDFGFHPDPDAMVKIAIDHKQKKIYGKQCFYADKQLVSNLKENVKAHVKGQELIIADSANPRMIAELSKHNIRRIKKYPGCVAEGIRIVQDYELIIDPDSYDLTRELTRYMWNDKKAGIPVDADNHLLDGLRYVVQTLTKHQGQEFRSLGVA